MYLRLIIAFVAAALPVNAATLQKPPLTLAKLDKQLTMDEAEGDSHARAMLHQIRNHQAMTELVQALPTDERPRSILYLASGSHMAPLAVCEALPKAEPCTLTLTEIDPDVASAIEAFLTVNGAIAMEREPDSAADESPNRQWRFVWAGHPVRLTLRINSTNGDAAPQLIDPTDLPQTDLIISHDWSGDPLGNLQVIRELLLAARSAGVATPPKLMIEDLRAHPFPIDLGLFNPEATSKLPYGHRTSDAGIGRHGEVELGTAIFSGATVLAFSDPWWREVSASTFEGMLDLLLFAPYDTTRQNVLEGGDDPLIAPAMLDWWTGYGARTADGRDVRSVDGFRQRILRDAAVGLSDVDGATEQRLACLLATYRSLLEAKASNLDFRAVLPGAEYSRRPKPGAFPSPEMESFYRAAMRNAREFRSELTVEAADSRNALSNITADRLNTNEAACPVSRPEGDIAWLERYKSLTEWLANGS